MYRARKANTFSFFCWVSLSVAQKSPLLRRPLGLMLGSAPLSQVWRNVYGVARSFCGLAIFCALRKLILANRTDYFFVLGKERQILYSISVFMEYVQWKYIFSNNTSYLCETNKTVIWLQSRRTDTISLISTVFLYSEFKSSTRSRFLGEECLR